MFSLSGLLSYTREGALCGRNFALRPDGPGVPAADTSPCLPSELRRQLVDLPPHSFDSDNRRECFRYSMFCGRRTIGDAKLCVPFCEAEKPSRMDFMWEAR